MRLASVIQFEGTKYSSVKLGDSSTIDKTDDVYTIGYSTIGDNTTVISRGEVSKVGNNVMEYTIQNPTTGFFGAPVLDSNGAVVALTVDITNDGYRAVPINQIKPALDTFSITYTSASETTPITISSNPVSEDSVKTSPDGEQNDTQPDKVSQPVDSVSNAESSSQAENSVDLPDEEEGNNTVMIIIIASIAVAVVIVIAIIIVLASKSKPKVSPSPYPVPYTQGGNPPANGGGMPSGSGQFQPPMPPSPMPSRWCR